MTIEPFLKCKDMPASVKFYTDVLDFDLVAAPNPDPEHFGSRYAAVSREGHILHLSSHGTEDGEIGAEIYI